MDRGTYLKNVKPSSAGWVKYSGGPVMGGDLGTCFDISMMEQNGRCRMWFSWRPKKSIAYTESKDGIHWGAPVIVLGPRETPEGWERDLNRPAVVLRDGLYHMWYTGQLPGKLPRAVDGRSWLFYATSTDGLNWQRASLQPVLSAEEPWEKVALMSPHVLWDEDEMIFKMWYSGGEQYEPNAIGYATSRDGLHWDKYPANPVFYADPNYLWEQHKVAAPQIIRKGGWYLMFYIGYFDEDTAQIGLARSRDGITGWERHPQNPIVAPSLNEWDAEACYKPFALFDGAMWRLWYNGRNGAFEQIGLVTHDSEDLGFPE